MQRERRPAGSLSNDIAAECDWLDENIKQVSGKYGFQTVAGLCDHLIYYSRGVKGALVQECGMNQQSAEQLVTDTITAIEEFYAADKPSERKPVHHPQGVLI